jgi:ornithine carbamoyltransferase
VSQQQILSLHDSNMEDSGMQHFLNLNTHSSEELMRLVNTAIQLKQRAGSVTKTTLQGKTLAMVFQRPSLRTRLSFEMAMHQLGGHAVYMNAAEIGLGQRESLPDVARVLGQYADAILARLLDYASLLQMAEHSPVPVINGLTPYNHPCQAMADILTLYEEFGQIKGLRLVYLGRSNQDVARSLLFAAAKFGFQLIICSPSEYCLDSGIIEYARAIAGDKVVEYMPDPLKAVTSADALYTDVWISVGTTDAVEAGHRVQILAPYQLNLELLKMAPDHAIVLHCMPANRGQEITDAVADGARSRLLVQAQNRLHIQKSILLHLLNPPS